MMVQVRIPATAANLGSGFDCLALALHMFNVVSLERSDSFSIAVVGEGELSLPRDETNLAYRAVQAFYRAIQKPVPPLRLKLTNEVPLGRGLGSSAAAVVGGLVGANALNGSPLDYEELLRLAYQLEGHLDNVAAALYGGLVVAADANGGVECARIPVPADVRAVVFIPDFSMPTDEARAVLPLRVSREDAVFNIGRAALVVAAFSTGRLELLRTATEDRLHQPYRRQMFPSMDRFFEEARRAGACGVFLSGAGSTILALTRGSEQNVARALREVAAREGIVGQTATLELCNQGAQVSYQPSAVGSLLVPDG